MTTPMTERAPERVTEAPEQTRSVLRNLVATRLGLAADALDFDAPMADAGIDSLALADWLFTVEEKFGVELSARQSDGVTLNDGVNLIEAAPRPAATSSGKLAHA